MSRWLALTGAPVGMLRLRDVVGYVASFFPREVLNAPPHSECNPPERRAEGGVARRRTLRFTLARISHHLTRTSRNQTGRQTWRERPRLPQTDSSGCSAPGRVIRFRQLTALPSGNASTNRGAANLEVHATSRLGALTLPPKSSATIGKNLTMQVLTVGDSFWLSHFLPRLPRIS